MARFGIRLFAMLGVQFSGLLSASAIADVLQFELTTPQVFLSPGEIVSMGGRLTNLTGSTYYLNGTRTFADPLAITINSDPFFSNAPLTLLPGESTSGAWFDLSTLGAAPAGVYSVSFAIQGGLGPDDFQDLAVASASVTISSVPEPSLPLLYLCGLAVLGVRGFRRLTCEIS